MRDSWGSGIQQLCSKQIDDPIEFPVSYLSISLYTFVFVYIYIYIEKDSKGGFSKISYSFRFCQ